MLIIVLKFLGCYTTVKYVWYADLDQSDVKLVDVFTYFLMLTKRTQMEKENYIQDDQDKCPVEKLKSTLKKY